MATLNEDAAYKRAVTGQNGDRKLPFSQLKMDAKFIYYYFIVVNELYHLKIILTVNINFVLQDIVERKSCESETSSGVTNDRFLLLYQLLR